MKIIGLTGGIGSGKTTVARMFAALGVPVYIADDRAKYIMHTDPEVRNAICTLFGKEAYRNDQLNKQYLATIVFSDPEKLQQLNAIVHPAVDKDFQDWLHIQDFSYVIKEAAILFESGGYKKCDQIILVQSPERIRVERVIHRDKTTEKEVRNRMKNQWTDDKKRALSDHIINNINISDTERYVRNIHVKLLS